MDNAASKILDFWFSKPMNTHWFSSNEEIDQLIKERFETNWYDASQGHYNHWSSSANGCLALVILLDQIPLNIFRGQAKSFSTEKHAVKITKFALDNHFDEYIDKSRLAFLYMPLMHSENLMDQDLAIECFGKSGLDHNLRFAIHHRDLIKRFGRFPHRNKILGRESRADEIEYLNSAGAFTG